MLVRLSKNWESVQFLVEMFDHNLAHGKKLEKAFKYIQISLFTFPKGNCPHSQFVSFCQVYRPRPYFDLLSVSVFNVKINTTPERHLPIPVSSNICLPRRTKTHILHLCFKSSIWFVLKNFKLNFSNFPKHLFVVLYLL